MFRLIILVGVFIGVAWACTSDCTSCHPTLDIVRDVRHQPLQTCLECHPPESLKDTPMGTGCGTDCFACHSTDKLIAMPQHEVIQGCIGCHQGMDKKPFTKQPITITKTKENELKNLFLKETK